MKYDFDRVIERRRTDSYKWKKYDEEVIPLWIADMDYISAEPIIQALHQRVDHGIFGYTRPTDELRIVIRERLKRLYQWDIQYEEIIFLPGLVTGLNLSFHVYAAPGEGVLIQPPIYFHFVKDPVMHGRVLNDPPLIQNGDTYEIDFEAFERSITDRTKVFLLCNPHNPVARVYTVKELEKIAEICLRYNIIICSCVSKGNASPLTAKLKCPHGRGKDTHESEAVTEVARDGFGGGRKDHLGGGS